MDETSMKGNNELNVNDMLVTNFQSPKTISSQSIEKLSEISNNKTGSNSDIRITKIERKLSVNDAPQEQCKSSEDMTQKQEFKSMHYSSSDEAKDSMDNQTGVNDKISKLLDKKKSLDHISIEPINRET